LLSHACRLWAGCRPMLALSQAAALAAFCCHWVYRADRSLLVQCAPPESRHLAIVW
jgi:hypothetical protein